jgi:hypothetical protein
MAAASITSDDSGQNIEWTALTDRPGLAERFASRAFRASRRQLHPWWLVAGPVMVYWIVEVAAGWSHRDVSRTVLSVVSLLLIGFMFWTRQGFCDLLERYDAELRRRQSGVQ